MGRGTGSKIQSSNLVYGWETLGFFSAACCCGRFKASGLAGALTLQCNTFLMVSMTILTHNKPYQAQKELLSRIQFWHGWIAEQFRDFGPSVKTVDF